MLEARYRGAETLNYRQTDLSELKYIKIIYNDIKGEPHEFKTETNFLSDNYISLFIKRTRKNEQTEEVGYQKITNASLEGIAQSTASWMSTHCAGMADGTYSTADIVSAGGADANTLIGYVNNAWQLGQS